MTLKVVEVVDFSSLLPSDDHVAHSKNASDNGPRSANQSPQSVGSSGIDSGVETTSDGMRDLPSIAISVCGGLSDNKEITKGMQNASSWLFNGCCMGIYLDV